MWTIDNIEDIAIYLWLFIISPIMCYSLYSLAEINVAIWLIISVVCAGVITFFVSPFLMITLAIMEGVLKVFLLKKEM